jgi:hypothetical protein
MILDITENPFYILDAKLTDDKEKIIALANEKYASFDVGIIDEAKENLLDLNKRLYYEMRWFPANGGGIEIILNYINKVKSEKKYYENNILIEINVANSPPGIFMNMYVGYLTFLNIDFYTFSYINDNELLANAIIKLAWQYNDSLKFIDKITDDINSGRRISKFNEITDKNIIMNTINLIERDIKALIMKKMKTLEKIDLENILSIIMDRCKKDNDFQNFSILRYLFSEYNDVIKIYQTNEIYSDFVKISENPFFIIGADITDNKRRIMSICEEKMIFENTDIINKAQEQLLDSHKRLKAELGWFPTCSKDQIQAIINYLNDLPNKIIFEYIPNSFLENLSNLEKFNIALYSLIYLIGSPGKWSKNTIGKGTINKNAFKYDINKEKMTLFILQISELYELLQPEAIKDIINEKRKISGFPIITEVNSIEEELNNSRKNIKKVLSFFITNITLIIITDVLINIHEHYKNENKFYGVIIDDFISEYFLLSKDIINRRKDDIVSEVEEMLQNRYLTNLASINSVLSQLEHWDHLVQPLQLEALTKGMRHNESIIMANKFRELSLYCNNELKRTDLALKITKELQKYFVELTDFYQLLLEDEKTLNDIQNKILENEYRIKYLKEKKQDADNEYIARRVINIIGMVIFLLIVFFIISNF